ncbi:MAG: hypothetical protein KGJ23_08570 [Euryarchaeota archaeon]|nr:hypothetical protein [Euryarchaeota archaeon]MDE1836656.1 hypothetical protein [Euryarchaeota archaeon]MDE1880315.1 hypothetical protein [Euryarchaeota archaeon]MDE2044626.1 hypothetical protein [Thermoplasmata archaeon]
MAQNNPVSILEKFAEANPLVAEVGGGGRIHFEPVGFIGFIPTELVHGYLCRYCPGTARTGGNAITFKPEEFKHADDCPWAQAKAWVEESRK